MVENIVTKIATRGSYTNPHESFSAVANYLATIRPPVKFVAKPTVVDETILQDSATNRDKIFFTPEGIVVGGFLVAEPNNPEVWAKKSDVRDLQDTVANLFNIEKPMTYAGIIGSSGVVEKLGDQIGTGFERYVSASEQPEVVTNGVVGANATFTFFEDDMLQETIPALNIKGIAFHIHNYMSNTGNPTNTTIVFGSEPDTSGYPLHLRIVYYGTNGTSAIDKEVTLPYTFTQEELGAISNIRWENDSDGMWLYSRLQHGSSNVYVSGSNSQFNTVNLYLRAISFATLPQFIPVKAGYVFISNYDTDATHSVIPGVSIERGDLIIMTSNVQGREITSNDFLVVSGRVDLASATNSGLMSSAHYVKLETMTPSAYLTASDLPAFEANDESNSTGVTKTSAGIVRAKLNVGTITRTPSQADQYNHGLALQIQSSAGNALGGTTELPYAAANAWGVVRVDGTTITANSNGVISANLTWS